MAAQGLRNRAFINRHWIASPAKPGGVKHIASALSLTKDKLLRAIFSHDLSITINRINDVTIVSTRDRNTGEVSTETTFVGDSPYGK